MTGPLASVEIATLVQFALGSFIAVCAATLVSGFLPYDIGDQSSVKRPGRVVLYTAIALIVFLLIVLVFVALRLPLAVVIVVFGLAILGGPLVVDAAVGKIPYGMREPLMTLRLTIGFTALFIAVSLFLLV